MYLVYFVVRITPLSSTTKYTKYTKVFDVADADHKDADRPAVAHPDLGLVDFEIGAPPALLDKDLLLDRIRLARNDPHRRTTGQREGNESKGDSYREGHQCSNGMGDFSRVERVDRVEGQGKFSCI